MAAITVLCSKSRSPLCNLHIISRELRRINADKGNLIAVCIGDHGICANLLGGSMHSCVVLEQTGVKAEHILRRIEAGDGITAKARRSEGNRVLASADRPGVVKTSHQLVLTGSDKDQIICSP